MCLYLYILIEDYTSFYKVSLLIRMKLLCSNCCKNIYMYIDKIPVPQSVCEMNSKRNNADLTLLYPYRGYMNFSQIFAMHLGDNSDHIKYIYTY